MIKKGLGPPRLERGLRHFVDDIKECKNRDSEGVRVRSELEKIDEKFKKSKVSPYELRKYICKLTYIRVLGYDVPFGSAHVLGLASSRKIRDKALGYCAAIILFDTESEEDLYRTFSEMWSHDAMSNDYEAVGLALSAAASSGHSIPEVCAVRSAEILKDVSAPSFLRQKAVACLSRLCRDHAVYPGSETVAHNELAYFVRREEIDDLRLSSVLLLKECARNGDGLLRRAIAGAGARLAIELEKNATASNSTDSLYHGIYQPWLRVACVRLAALENDWTHDREMYTDLSAVASTHTKEALPLKDANAENARNAIRIEWLLFGASFQDITSLCRNALTAAAEQSLNPNLSAAARRALDRLDGKPLSDDSIKQNWIDLFDETGEDQGFIQKYQQGPRVSMSVVTDLLTFDDTDALSPSAAKLPPNPFGRSSASSRPTFRPPQAQQPDLLLGFDDIAKEDTPQPAFQDPPPLLSYSTDTNTIIHNTTSPRLPPSRHEGPSLYGAVPYQQAPSLLMKDMSPQSPAVGPPMSAPTNPFIR